MLGPLKLGAEEIARLLATIVGALADLLVPKSLVRAGLDGIRWLVQLPPVGTPVGRSTGGRRVRMPHLVELREVLTWIGVTLLPLGSWSSGGARVSRARRRRREPGRGARARARRRRRACWSTTGRGAC